MKFKVGDIIKGKKGNGYGCTDEDMTKAKVIEVDNVDMEIEILEHKNKCSVGSFFTVDNSSEKFELASFKRPTKQELFDMPIGTKIYTDAKDEDYQEWIKATEDDFVSEKCDEWIDEDDIEDDLTLYYDDYGTKVIKIEEPTYATIYKYSTKEVKEMTVSEIEKELGYPIKVIKEREEN